MAEREGFEPSNGLPRCQFSRLVHSTTQPPLHLPVFLVMRPIGLTGAGILPVLSPELNYLR